MDQPPWLAAAWAELGQREIAGAADNARILSLFCDAGHPEIANDETAWCAAFVGACLTRSGLSGTTSLMARSYLSWGAEIDEGRLGAVVVFSRGSDPALGHVGFLVGETGDGLLVLGGNQGDAVSVQRFDRSILLGLRWPGETDAKTDPDVFETALVHVLELEGGYDDDPADPGGPTNRGITLADLAGARGMVLGSNTRDGLLRDLRSISSEEVRRIYLDRYWRPSLAGRLPPALAVMHFDCAVNMGLGTAARMLQEAVGADVDGEIGPRTLAAAARAEIATTLDRYAERRRLRYRSLSTFPRFGRGWLNRVEVTLRLARSLDSHPSQPKGASDMPTTNDSATAAPRAPSEPVATSTLSPKWWGDSMTVWGTLITAAATVLPAFGPLIGLDISAATVKQVGHQTMDIVQAVGGLVGTLMALYGRSRATQPLIRRDLTLKL